MIDRTLIMGGIGLLVIAAAAVILFPDVGRRWGLRLAARFADFRDGEKVVIAGRGGISAGAGAERPVFGNSTGALSPHQLGRLEEQILTNLSKAMPVNLHYVADDEDCAALAKKIWDFLRENDFRRGEYSGALQRGAARGLHITMKAESYDMTIAPPR